MDAAAIATKFAEHGILGLVVVVLAIVCYKVYFRADEARRQTDAIQAQRVSDAQAVAAQMSKFCEQMASTVARATAASEAQADAFDELRKTVAALGEDQRVARLRRER